MAKKAMWFEEERLKTFSDWPFGSRSACTAEKMAATGFFVAEKGTDNVKCFMCSKELDGWDCDDDPAQEHRRHAPACPRLNLHLEENRLLTFKHWPHTKGYKAKPADFARAGWVHRPSRDAVDNVECISCGKNLDGWEKDDDPLAEHIKRGRNCAFVQAMVNSDGSVAGAAADPLLEANEAPVVTGAAKENASPRSEAATKQGQKRKGLPPKGPGRPPKVATIVKKNTDISEAEGIDQDMTVEEYLKNQCEVQIHQLVSTCEARIVSFTAAATAAREQIIALTQRN